MGSFRHLRVATAFRRTSPAPHGKFRTGSPALDLQEVNHELGSFRHLRGVTVRSRVLGWSTDMDRIEA